MTTAPTSKKLADALNAVGFNDLSLRASANEFHEFLSPHAFPEMMLAELLADEAGRETNDETKRMAAHHLRLRLIDGEFESSEEESTAWALSEEGQAAFKRLGG